MPSKTYLTDLSCQSCVKALTPFLDKAPHISRWSVDLSTDGHPLSVEGDEIDHRDLQEILKSAGYNLGEEILQISANAEPTGDRDRLEGSDTQSHRFSESDSVTTSAADLGESPITRVNKILRTYYPLILIFIYLGLATLVYAFRTAAASTEIMNFFMGLFFTVFSFFKMLNWKGFARSFRMYDPLAKLSGTYARAYPLLELGLGLAYFLHLSLHVTNAVAAAIMGIGALGISISLMKKQEIECACLGTLFKLPMSIISLIEDLVMFVMAILMLVKI